MAGKDRADRAIAPKGSSNALELRPPWTFDFAGGQLTVDGDPVIAGGVPDPGGADGDIQYNDGGDLGGFGIYDDAADEVILSGDLTLVAASDDAAAEGVLRFVRADATGAQAGDADAVGRIDFLAVDDLGDEVSGVALTVEMAGAAEGGVAPMTATLSADLRVPDQAYGVGWDGSLEVPTKNALYAKIEAVSGGAGITAEEALDAVGAALVAGNNIDITVNDGADTITIDVEGLTSADLSDFAAAVDERARDAVGTALVAGNNIDITVDDAGNTITIDVESLTSADVGLGNVDNTSDATKNAAAVTLTNKTLTAPTIADFTNMGHDHLDADDGGTLTAAAISDFAEVVADTAGAMFSGNTETFIAATYQDGDNTIDLVVPVLDEDDFASDSAAHLATQQSIKAYVDAVVGGGGYTDEMARDAVGTALVAGNNIDITVDDGGDTITVAVETLAVADISDLTASAAEINTMDGITATTAELNALDGITATVTELNYTDGVTSAIQTQIDGKQPLDADLTTIAGLTATTDNFMVAVSSAWASRTPSQAKTTLALVKGDVGLGNVDNTSDATKNAAAVTLTNKTLTAPTIADFTNAAHDHGDADDGGTLTLAALPDVTASAAELNILDGATLTVTELNFVDGVTSAIQTQIDGKQPLDADLTTIAGLTATTNNFLVASGSAWASRTPTQAIAHLGLDADIATLALPASTTISAFGASLIDDAANSNARTTLGLVIGSDVQAYNAGTHKQIINFLLDGGGSAITTGVKGDIVMPDFAGTIAKWTLLGDQSGSIVIDLWLDSYANFAPTVADTITASAKPTISTATKGQSSTLTGWTTTFSAGAILRVNVDSIASLTRCTMALDVLRT